MNAAASNQQNLPDHPEEIDIASLFHQLIVHKWLIFIITFSCFILSILYNIIQKPVYQANLVAQIKIKDKQNIAEKANYILDSQRIVIKSEAILGPVVQSLGLPAVMLNKIYDQLKIVGSLGPVDDLVVNISLQDTNPHIIVNILNKIGEVLQQNSLQQKSRELSQELQILQAQLQLAKKSLVKTQHKFNHIYQSNTFATLDNINLQSPADTLSDEKISILQDYMKNIEQTLKTLPETTRQQMNLINDIERKTKEQSQLLSKIQILQVEKAHPTSDILILSKASLPSVPLPNHNKLINIFSILSGLLLSTFIVFGRKLLFPKIENPDWSQRHLKIVNLATIPFAAEERSLKKKTYISNNQLPLLANIHPQIRAVDALRNFRIHLQLHSAHAQNNMISMLSVSPNAGKTFITSNLAYLLALTGKKVLLIDADLRQGTLHDYFNLPASPGLSELIQHNSAPDTILKTPIEHLSILTRGECSAHPSELLGSQQFKDIMARFSQTFDIILIDNTPLLPVMDAMLIASIAATNYMVLGFHAQKPDQVETTMNCLMAANITIQGTIFNFCVPTKHQKAYTTSYAYIKNAKKETLA